MFPRRSPCSRHAAGDLVPAPDGGTRRVLPGVGPVVGDVRADPVCRGLQPTDRPGPQTPLSPVSPQTTEHL